MTRSLTHRLVAAAAALTLAGSLAACSSDSNEGSEGTTPTVAASTPTPGGSASASTPTSSGGSASAVPQVCKDIAQARLSLAKVSSVPVVTQGRDAIKAQWETAKADANTAVESARAEFPDEAQAVSDSLDRIETAVTALEATPSAQALAELARAVAASTAAVTALDNALRETC